MQCLYVIFGAKEAVEWNFVPEKYNLTVQSVTSYNSSFELLVEDLKKYKKKATRLPCFRFQDKAERLAKDLQEHELNAFYGSDYDRRFTQARLW